MTELANETLATPISPEERAAALSRAVAQYAGWGWRVQSQTPTSAQLVKGHRTNHILHLILSIITLGVWLIVWALMAILGGEKHKLLTVDEYGRVT